MGPGSPKGKRHLRGPTSKGRGLLQRGTEYREGKRESERRELLPPWASAHRGKWGQLTPWKMYEKLKSENMQKRAVFYIYVIF